MLAADRPVFFRGRAISSVVRAPALHLVQGIFCKILKLSKSLFFENFHRGNCESGILTDSNWVQNKSIVGVTAGVTISESAPEAGVLLVCWRFSRPISANSRTNALALLSDQQMFKRPTEEVTALLVGGRK